MCIIASSYTKRPLHDWQADCSNFKHQDNKHTVDGANSEVYPHQATYVNLKLKYRNSLRAILNGEFLLPISHLKHVSPPSLQANQSRFSFVSFQSIDLQSSGPGPAQGIDNISTLKLGDTEKLAWLMIMLVKNVARCELTLFSICHWWELLPRYCYLRPCLSS